MNRLKMANVERALNYAGWIPVVVAPFSGRLRKWMGVGQVLYATSRGAVGCIWAPNERYNFLEDVWHGLANIFRGSCIEAVTFVQMLGFLWDMSGIRFSYQTEEVHETALSIFKGQSPWEGLDTDSLERAFYNVEVRVLNPLGHIPLVCALLSGKLRQIYGAIQTIFAGALFSYAFVIGNVETKSCSERWMRHGVANICRGQFEFLPINVFGIAAYFFGFRYRYPIETKPFEPKTPPVSPFRGSESTTTSGGSTPDRSLEGDSPAMNSSGPGSRRNSGGILALTVDSLQLTRQLEVKPNSSQRELVFPTPVRLPGLPEE
jgi:hypothetical protein